MQNHITVLTDNSTHITMQPANFSSMATSQTQLSKLIMSMYSLHSASPIRGLDVVK